MSEDEVKSQAEESPKAVKVDEEEDVKVEKSKIEEEEEEEEAEDVKSENDKAESEEEDKEEEEEKEVKEEVKPTPKKAKKAAAAPVEEGKTPEKGGVPLYDQPLEMSGKRDRKKVDRFIQEEKKEELKIEGDGLALGEIPFIEAMITKCFADELKTLHRIAYGRPGSIGEIKKNLRKFNGFGYSKDDKKFEAKVQRVEKITKSELGKMLKILGLEISGSKPEQVKRLLDYMIRPVDTGKKLKVKKSKSGKGKTKKGTDKKKKVAAAESVSDSSSDSSDSPAEEEEEEQEEEEEASKKKKAKKTPAKKPVAAKKTPSAKKKTPAKRPAPAKKTATKVSSDDSDSDSDDEPLAKKTKQPPTDGELKILVKKILDGANLEEVTMKSVCRQVYDSYPDFDLAHKKDFIKETVKSIIS